MNDIDINDLSSGPNCKMIREDLERVTGPPIDEMSRWMNPMEFLRSSNSITDLSAEASRVSPIELEEPVPDVKTDRTILSARQRSLRQRNVVLNNLLGPLSPPNTVRPEAEQTEDTETAIPNCDKTDKVTLDRHHFKGKSKAVDLDAVVAKLNKEFGKVPLFQPSNRKEIPVGKAYPNHPPNEYFKTFLNPSNEEVPFKIKSEDFPTLL